MNVRRMERESAGGFHGRERNRKQEEDEGKTGSRWKKRETVTVYHGNNSAYNEFNVSFDISGFTPGAYTAEAQSVTTGVGTTTSFNVLEGVPTPIPTHVPTTLPTPPPTPVPTNVPTTLPTTTPTPGFAPGIALSGLCAAAVLIVRGKR